MKSCSLLSVAGLLLLFAPGCCALHHVGGCGSVVGGCGVGHCDGGKFSRKCARKCRKCMKCLEEEGCGIGQSGMLHGDVGLGGGCGCGACGGGEVIGGEITMGGMMPGGFAGPGGCASCGHGGPMPMPGPMHPGGGMSMPSEAYPGPASGVNLSHPQVIPAVPPTEGANTNSVPQGTQHVSVEEFQRLPGVVVSGPTPVGGSSQPMSTSTVPGTITVSPASPPIQQAAAASNSTSTNARQIQQTGWAPVRR